MGATMPEEDAYRIDPTAPATLAAAVLEESKGVTPKDFLVSVGDNIAVQEENYLKGLGTMLISDEDGSQLVASICGAVKRVNKLVMVQPFKRRYTAELGDVVVGRVTEVQTRRWVVDIACTAQVALQLSAVQLPGGAQRRRNASDELNMRQLFQEQDLVASEVQAINRQDGNVALHMRGSKYGKLRYGQLVCVPCKLIRRQSSHFVDLKEHGIQLVIGCNGWVFVGLKNRNETETKAATAPFGAGSAPVEFVDFTPEPEQWRLCAKFVTAIKCVAKIGVPVNVELLQEIVQESEKKGVACTSMLQIEFLTVVMQLELNRRGHAEVQGMDEG